MSANATVIRPIAVSTEHASTRVLNRHVPAWVVSGAIHAMVICCLVLFMSGATLTEAKPNDLTITQVDDPKDDNPNLTEPELGFDADLKPTTDAEREEANNVVAPKIDDIGLENQPNIPSPTAIGGPLTDQMLGGLSNQSAEGAVQQGPGGGTAMFTVPGLEGRFGGATKDALIAKNGGNPVSEAAVAAGLAWLARKQLKDGSWEFDGSSKDKIAATGMALLPFLAAGETHKYATKYKDTVRKGLEWL